MRCDKSIKYTYAPVKREPDKKQQAIARSNARWMNTPAEVYESPKHGNKRKTKFDYCMLQEPDGWGKKFKHVRG